MAADPARCGAIRGGWICRRSGIAEGDSSSANSWFASDTAPHRTSGLSAPRRNVQDLDREVSTGTAGCAIGLCNPCAQPSRKWIHDFRRRYPEGKKAEGQEGKVEPRRYA